MAEFENILFERADGVATITLNRPERLNPLTHGPGSMHADILEGLRLAEEDKGIRCVVITGAGRAFSSGGSMNKDAPKPVHASEWLRFHQQNNDANDRIRRQSKPVIGAINGMCYGAALVMATHFDFLIASDAARFGLIETRFGAPGVDMLAYHVGPQWAKFLALSGEIISAERARQIGLVLEVVVADDFAVRVADLARRVAAMPAESAMLNRRLVNGAMEAMGWSQQKQLVMALNAITNTEIERAAGPDGRVLVEILDEDGWDAYKEARDAPFKPAWLTERP